MDQPAGGAFDRVGGTDHRQPNRPRARGPGPAGGRPEGAGHLFRPCRPLDVLDLAGDDLAVHVDGLGDDPFGGDADDQGDAQTGSML